MRALLALIALLCFLDVQACEVSFPERMIVTGVDGSHWPFAHTNCSPENISAVRSMLHDHDGMISLARLQAAVGGTIKLVSTVDQVRIQRLSQLIEESFPQSAVSDMEMKTLDADIVGLSSSGEINLKCHPCLFNGDETIRVNVRSFNGQQKAYNFAAKFGHYVLAAKAKVSISAFSGSMNSDQFELVKVPQVAYGRYQTELSKIHYYKPNKTIRAGELLRETDLVPLTLVRAGDKVDLYFENEQLRVRSHATSRQNGGMGDKIDVWNQATGKKYRGVITDHNRVVVEL